MNENNTHMLLIIMYWLLLTTLPHSHSESLYDYSDCKTESYKCGDLSGISYPFWGHNRPPQCGGGDSFKLNCDESNTATTILIGSQNFTVKEFSHNIQTLRLVRTDLALNICSPQFEDIYFNNTTPLWYLSSKYNATLFYDCPPISELYNDLYPNFTCGQDICYYSNGMGYEMSNESEFRSCKRLLHLPTHGDSNYYFEGRHWSPTVKETVNEGFEVKYNVSRVCTECLGIEGDCLSGGDQSLVNCYYCTDGSHGLHCSPRISSNSSIIVTGVRHTGTMIKKIIIAGVGVLMGGFMICIIICCRKCMPSARKLKIWLRIQNDQDFETFLKNHEVLAQKRYKYSEVKKMTNSFKVKLGQGGFGSIYKGELLSGTPVAVKILNSSKGNGEDFINEVASISRTSHVNIVALLGFCLEGHKKALIYEYMPNGSLDKFVYNKGLKTTQSLSWDNLWQISIGIARGLEYLHRGCNTRILHFDIKPHNILLDDKFCPKISDFGLAKLCPRNESIISLSDQRGTIGYVAPEVWNRHFGGISYKSDVYSYGMMLLEMVGGRKNINAEASNTSEIYFPDWIYKRLEGGDLRADGPIVTEENDIARRMTVVGLWCVQTFAKDRPTMSRVIDMLEGNISSLEMPPKPVLSCPTRLVPFSISSLQSE